MSFIGLFRSHLFWSLLLVVLVSILTWPKIQRFLAEARQVEAKENLNVLYNLEQKHFLEHGTYVVVPMVGIGRCDTSKNKFGFIPSLCNQGRYRYEVVLNKEKGFLAYARSGIGKNNLVFPGCLFADIWQIDERRKFKNNSSLAKCLK